MSAAGAPGMLTFAERAHLRDLAAAAPQGRIVELGTFLGASAECLFEGAGDRFSEDRSLLVYDAFLTTPDMYDLYPMPYQAGESFRTLFDMFQRDRLTRMTVREGYLPEDAGPASSAAVYPEQEPIALLFVDLAKTAGVHRTVARAFFPHLREGVSVVQQDFKHPYCTWLPLHMHALREWFTPTHDVAGWTVTFRCESPPPAEAMDPARLTGERLSGRAIDSAWDDVARWLLRSGMERAASGVDLHRAMHLVRDAQWERAQRAAERAIDAQAAFGASAGEASDAFRSNVGFVADEMRRLGDAGAEAARRPADALLERVRALSPDDPERVRWALWRQVAETLRAHGHRRVALMGDKTFAQKLLGSGWPGGRLDVVAVLDEEGRSETACEKEVLDTVDVVVVCSQASERALAARAERVFSARGAPVVMLSASHLVTGARL